MQYFAHTRHAGCADLQPNIKEAEHNTDRCHLVASYGWGMRDGLERGRQEGIKQGEFKKAQEIARNLLQLGVLTEDEIARIAGLPLEEIQQLPLQH